MKGMVTTLACLFAITFLLAGDGATQTPVRVGDLGIMSDAPFYIALEKGYFKERGIEVRLERFAAALAMASLAAGELQVVGGGIAPPLFNALARGLPVKIVAPRHDNAPNNSYANLAIRADLKDQIRRIADLKGKKISTTARGTAAYYMLGKALESESLTFKDVEMVYMPWPDMGPAFARKAIDAAILVEPFLTQYQEKGYAIPWKDADDVIKEWQVSAIFYNIEWADKNPQVAKDFMVAYIRAAREFYEASYGGKNRPEVIEILAKYTKVKDKALYEKMRWGVVEPNGKINKESIREQQDWLAKEGLVPTKIDVDKLVDDRYAKYAVEQLGVYTPRRPAR